MDDFLVAGPADDPEEALNLLRTTAIASFGEAVREIAREHFQYCNVHRRAVPRPAATAEAAPSHPADASAQRAAAECICPPGAPTFPAESR